MASEFSVSSPQITASPVRASRRGSSRRRRPRLRPLLFDRAYAREMLLPMTLGMMVLMLVLAANFVYWAINSIVNQGISIVPVIRLFVLALPGFAVQGLPVGVILSVCLVLNRAVRDSEIIALRAGGASIPRILLPFLTVALLAAMVDLVIINKVSPRTNQMATKSLLKLMHASSTQFIEGDKYFRVGKYWFYVRSVNDKVLQNVMVYVRGTGDFAAFTATNNFPTVHIAGTAYEDPKIPNRWIFENVVTHTYDDQGRQKYEAQSANFSLNVGQQLSTYWAEQKDSFAMSSDELSTQIKALDDSAFDAGKLRTMRIDYYRHFTLPFACFVTAMLAAPLSLRFARHGSFAGLVCAFALAFLWQGFDGWFRAVGSSGKLEPIVAAWGTNALFFTAGVVLLWRER